MAVPRNPNKFTLTRSAVAKTAAVVREAERARRAKDLTSGGYQEPHAAQKALVTVKVTRVLAAGKAEAIVQRGGITPDTEDWPDEDIDMPENFEAVKDGHGEPVTEFNCYLVDYAGGAFQVDQYYPCVRWGTSKNKDAKNNPYPIMEVLGAVDSLVLVKVTASRSDGRKYDAIIGKGRMIEVSGDLAMPADYTFDAPANAIVYNPGDPSGLHLIDPDDERERYRIGKVTGTVGSDGGDDAGKRLVTIDPYPQGVFPVGVTEDGGADGTAGTAATWTYTVKTTAGVSIDTEVELSKSRPNGKMVAGSTYGLAFYVGETLVLWDAGEKPGTGGCA